MIQQKANGMGWFLTESCLMLINHASCSLYERMNLIIVMADCVAAMLVDDSDKTLLKEVNGYVEALEELRSDYVPKMDTSEYATPARTKKELRLNQVLRGLMIVIYRKDLINPSLIGSVGGSHW